jgi:cell division protein FtsB
MKPGARELWWAAGAIVAITIVYLLVIGQLRGGAAASGLFGHGIGILGFVLMLATETLYSLRKRSRQARWGRTASWLRFHIFTGLVGPYMVLLHTSWKYNGLAGLATVLTLIVVASGFIGRYIYTAVPRTADGLMLEADDLQAQIAAAEAELQRWLANRPAMAPALARQLAALPPAPQNQLMLVLGRAFTEWRDRWQWRREVGRLDAAGRAQARQLEALAARRRALQRQVASLATARRLLGVWHAIHIPIGMALFTAAFVHIAAALYYATLLH